MRFLKAFQLAALIALSACSGVDGATPDGEENPELVATGRYELLGDCTVSVVTTPSAPQAAGTVVDITGSATCLNDTSPEYRFYVRTPSGMWQMVRDWGAGATFPWDSTGSQTGSHVIQVWARRTGQLDVEGVRTLTYDITDGRAFCTAGGLSSSSSSPQAAGPVVTMTGTADCGAATPEYRFLYRSPFGVWNDLRGWSTSATAQWDTSAFLAGSYEHQVWVRPAGTSVNYDTRGILPFELTSDGSSCMNLLANTNPASPRPAGSNVTVSASAECGGGAVPHFRFYERNPSGVWRILQDYSTASQVNWVPAEAGTYSLQIWMRRAGSAAANEAVRTLHFTATASEPGECGPVALTLSPSGTVATGAMITATASSTCTGSSVPEYRFFLRPPGGSYSSVQGYATTPTYAFTAGITGTYTVQVWKRQVGSAANYEHVLTRSVTAN